MRESKPIDAMDSRIFNSNIENTDLNNLIKHVDEVDSMKTKIENRFENEDIIKVSDLKEEISQRVSLMKMCDDELLFQFMKLFFRFDKDIITKKSLEENLEGFLSTLFINKSNKTN